MPGFEHGAVYGDADGVCVKVFKVAVDKAAEGHVFARGAESADVACVAFAQVESKCTAVLRKGKKLRALGDDASGNERCKEGILVDFLDCDILLYKVLGAVIADKDADIDLGSLGRRCLIRCCLARSLALGGIY